MIKKEIWKTIPNTNNRYKVSNTGKIKSYLGGKGKLMALRVHPKGYIRVGLMTNKKRKERTVHSIVVEVFLNHKQNGMKSMVNHIDKDRTNNHLDNLEIVTNEENLKDKRNNGILNGVFQIKSTGYWSSMKRIDGKYKRLGIHKHKQDALLEYYTFITN